MRTCNAIQTLHYSTKYTISLFTCPEKAVIFSCSFFFFLTQEKRAFSQSKAFISAWICKRKKSCLKRTSKQNRSFGTCKPAKCKIVSLFSKLFSSSFEERHRLSFFRKIPYLATLIPSHVSAVPKQLLKSKFFNRSPT